MITEEQQATLDRMVAMMTTQFEAANAKLGRMKALEPKMHVESAQSQSDRAAAMLMSGGAKPGGIMVMKDGKSIILERDEAITALKEGVATLN